MQQTLFATETAWERKFREFHAKNPQVYVALVRFAREAKARGRNKIGIELLINRVRWELFMNTRDDHSDFKINNNYKAYYARLIMEREPDMKTMFNTRELRS